MMQGSAWVPLTALFIYLFEFCTLVVAKKNALITRFLVMLVFLVLWSGGSVLMRLQFFGFAVVPYFACWHLVRLHHA